MELTIDHLSKEYKDKRAVDDVSLALTSGIWGLLGANGAGKTTLIRMIAGILAPSAGQIRYDGVDIAHLGAAYRDLFGYLPQEFGFYPEFTVIDYLNYMAALKGLPVKTSKRKIDELLESLALTDVRKKRIVKLSGGMKRRGGVAQALLNEPKVLILDEPTSGLDPAERVRFRNLIAQFAQDRIVLISTHIVSDVEYIAAQNALMRGGQLVAVGQTQQLVQQMAGKVWQCVISDEELSRWKQTQRIANLQHEKDHQVVVRYLAQQPINDHSEAVQPRLEDLYLWLFDEERGGDLQ